jgi:hypothetical protein
MVQVQEVCTVAVCGGVGFVMVIVCAMIYTMGFERQDIVKIVFILRDTYTISLAGWIITPKGELPNFRPTKLFLHKFGIQSRNGMYYCSNLAKPIAYSSVLVARYIINRIILKGITAALPTTVSYHPL